ncbi:CD63 antigen [Brachionus plicatilis]|uniref:CD63 antigen n=1 Tax=Brachionus plicatilis TaxID=10195 RepID=A0A3M7S9T1_BRAPC|nr:CD63 antigen [Brachionus plicatilis]
MIKIYMITSKTIHKILRIFLLINNVIFILLGLGLITTTCVLRWANIISISSLDQIKDKQYFNIVLNGIPISLIVYGLVVFLVGILGLYAVWTRNKILLIIQEIIVISIFLIHIGAIVAILVAWPTIESQFQKELNKTLEDANNKVDFFNFSELLSLEKQCNSSLQVSKQNECCGIMSPSDFNLLIRLNCCKVPTPKQGCLSLLIKNTKKYSIGLILVPMGAIFLMVILNIILVPIFVHQMRNNIHGL